MRRLRQNRKTGRGGDFGSDKDGRRHNEEGEKVGGRR